MKSNSRWGIIALLVLFWGCHKRQNYSHEHDFGESMLWKEPLQWSWKIQKNDFPYSLKADLQCAVHYPFDKIPLEWTETFPDGHTVIHELDVVVRNPDGTYNGDKALDYLNFDITLDDHHIYPEHGTYLYSIQPKMGVYEAAPFMVEIEIEAKETNPH